MGITCEKGKKIIENVEKVMVGKREVITFLLTALLSGGHVLLEDMPGSIARLWARFFLETEEKLAVEIQDLGFGEIRPSSGHVWREKVDIY